MYMKKLIYILFLTTVSFSLFAQPVAAQTRDLGNRVETARSESNRCTNVTEKINASARIISESNNNYISTYNAIIVRLENLERYLLNQNIESSELFESINYLKAQIDEFNSINNQVIRQLNQAIDIVCSDDPSEYGQIISAARTNLSQSKEVATITNQYLRTNLIDVLNRLLN